MDKNAVLKVINPALALLMLNQPFSAFLMAVTGWDLFESLHVAGEYCCCQCGGSSDVKLGWVASNFLKTAANNRPKKQRILQRPICRFSCPGRTPFRICAS